MTRCYVKRPSAIGYDHKDAWIRADVYRDGIIFDKHLDCPLNAKQCLQLAAWLVNAAKQLDPKTCYRVKS